MLVSFLVCMPLDGPSRPPQYMVVPARPAFVCIHQRPCLLGIPNFLLPYSLGSSAAYDASREIWKAGRSVLVYLEVIWCEVKEAFEGSR